jgi:hypothetical protein
MRSWYSSAASEAAMPFATALLVAAAVFAGCAGFLGLLRMRRAVSRQAQASAGQMARYSRLCDNGTRAAYGRTGIVSNRFDHEKAAHSPSRRR